MVSSWSTMHTLSTSSGSKGNQTMRCGQMIKVESHSIRCSADLSKNFSQLIVVCKYLSLLNFFFNRVCPVVKCRVTQHCLYRDSLTLTEWTPSCLIAVRGYIAFFQIFHPQNHFIMVLPFYQNVELGPSSHILLATPLLHIRIFWFHRKQKTFKTRQNSFYEQKVITNIK